MFILQYHTEHGYVFRPAINHHQGINQINTRNKSVTSVNNCSGIRVRWLKCEHVCGIVV
jgi:hypothetical protein